MKWTDDHDTFVLREILLFEPWNQRHGSDERGRCWEAISDSLNSLDEPKYNVSQRSVRDRYVVLEKNFKRKRNEENKASGICPEENENDNAVSDILERFLEAADQQKKISDEKQKALETDASAAKEMRNQSLETFAESKKRRKELEEDSPTSSKRTRNTGTQAIQFLK